MTTPTPNPYTPDKVPVEIPVLDEEVFITKRNPASMLMVVSIAVFVIIIFVEAFFLVQKSTNTTIEATVKGPTLQQ